MLDLTLKPNYDVKLIEDGRRRYYQVIDKSKIYDFGGVTSALDIIHKPAFVPWAIARTCEATEAALLVYEGQAVTIDRAFITGVITKAKKRAPKIKKDAANYGTRFHAYADKVIKGLPVDDVDDDLKNSVLGFKDWFRDSGIEIVAGDTKVASLLYEFGGSFDALGLIDGHYGIIDFKTANDCYKEYALQVGAYAHATLETYDIKCDWALILRLGKDTPDYEPFWVTDLRTALRGYLHAKELCQNLKQELLCAEQPFRN